MAITNITLTIDENLKTQAEKLFADRGLDMASVFQMFIAHTVREQQIPAIVFSETNQKGLANAKAKTEEVKQEFHTAEYMDVSAAEMLESKGVRPYSTGLYRV